MRLLRGLGVALFGAGLVVLGCGADRGNATATAGTDAIASTASAETLVDSPAAATRIAELRGRFRILERGMRRPRGAPRSPARSALGVPVATRFEASAGPDAAPHLRAVLSSEALRSVTRAARVALPRRANGEIVLEDETSHVSVRFALSHMQDTHIELAAGMALYRGALDGADVVHRVHAEGTEDFVVFEARPAREELSYSVDVSRVSGLRLVSNTLEFLDDTGTPTLRVAPPYVVDSRGDRHQAQLAVSGCAYDASPVGPRGRPITKAGANRCAVQVTWAGDIAYPAMVDPAWTATGSMAAAREFHSASTLPSGQVLVAGGAGGGQSAELFDRAGNAGAGTFAATGSMAVARSDHTASVLLSGKVLVTGGYYATAELYDSAAGTFTATGSMAAERTAHTASVLPSGRVLVAGGYNNFTVASTELFDPAGNAGAGAFVTSPAMAYARDSHTASVLPSGKVLIAGGYYGNGAELFDPAGNGGVGTFTATGAMGTSGRYHAAATVLPSGKVLVTGGSNVFLASTGAELFDPAGNAGAGTFAATSSMATMRAYHSASLLPSGKVLVAGGSSASGAAVSTELFDPLGKGGAGAFIASGSMANARMVHTASVLPTGEVLVVGGGNGGPVDIHTASAELFSFVAAGGGCAAGGECLSGFCADGVCCDTACAGGCNRCDLPGKQGTCTVVPVGFVGANPPCALPYACDGANAACPTSCASNAVCAPGFVCNAAQSTCGPAATCDGDHTATSADGTKHDCAPYKCDSNGTCSTTCLSVGCVAPATCDGTGKCVLPPAASAPQPGNVPPTDSGSNGSNGGSSGCSVVRANAENARAPLPWIAAVAGLLLLRRKRR